MSSRLALILLCLTAASITERRVIAADEITAKLDLTSPRDYQVFQRKTLTEGTVAIAGQLSFTKGSVPTDITLESRLIDESAAGAKPGEWKRLPWDVRVASFRFPINSAPINGWYRLEVRVRSGESTLLTVPVEHVGIGEVFIVAGQSNSANHGEGQTQPKTGRVSAFNGSNWQIANDPQPGASGGGGSFIPAFGDRMVETHHVPIGIAAVGVGATSVRQWLPKGERITILPTLTGHIVTVADETSNEGRWECTGGLFDNLMSRVHHFGPHGCRAILWHQGESDANQALKDRTLPGKLYAQHMETIIKRSRTDSGWPIPWFIAQASYHTPDDPGSEEIRTAQKSLWQPGLAHDGPDTDALTGDHRDGGGKGVHFSAKGLQAHGHIWAEKVSKVIDIRQ